MSYLLVVFALGILLLVHELGHLLVATKLGMPVERFSIGMGPVIKRVNYKGVEYCISLLPLGGYVLLKVEDDKDYFRLPVRKRILFALGGPVANLLFALPLFGIINVLTAGFSLQGLLITPFVQVAGISWAMVEAIRTLLSNPDQLSSVVGIVAQGGQLIASEMVNGLKLMALLSLNLAILNLLPIPVLDGGQILLTLAEKISPKVTRIRVPLAIAGWVFIIFLMVYATVLDVNRLT